MSATSNLKREGFSLNLRLHISQSHVAWKASKDASLGDEATCAFPLCLPRGSTLPIHVVLATSRVSLKRGLLQTRAKDTSCALSMWRHSNNKLHHI